MRNVIEILLNTHTHTEAETPTTTRTHSIISSSSIGDKEVDEQPQLLREEQDALFSYVHIFLYTPQTHTHIYTDMCSYSCIQLFTCLFILACALPLPARCLPCLVK